MSADELANILGPLDGAEIAGGCETCAAYQTVAAVSASMWAVTVHHDAWCPTLARHTANRATRRRLRRGARP